MSYWIYAIECISTGQTYVGQTSKGSPCWRWAEHVTDLGNGTNKCPLLQECWNQNSDLTQWQFRVLDESEGKISAKHREAELILSIPENLRLNTPKTSTISLERRRMIESMLKDGVKYLEIQDKTGISIGTISKIKHGRL